MPLSAFSGCYSGSRRKDLVNDANSHLHKLETCFTKQHGKNVSKIPGVVRKITDIMKKQLRDYKLDIPEEVLSSMVRTRTFIRINNMNKSILCNSSLQRPNKKLKKITS